MTQVIAPGPTTTRAVLTPPSKPLLPKRPRSGWPLSLAMMLCLGVVAGGFGGVLQEFEWWFVVFAALAIVLCTAATVRALTRRPWLPTVSAIVAAIVTPTLFFAADASLLGLIPTLDTVDRFQDLIRAGSDSITVQNVPATPTAGIVFLLVIGFAAVAVLADTLTFVSRWPALVGLALLALLIVPSSIDPSLNDPFFFLLTAASYLLFLYLTSNRKQGGTALALGAAALAGSLIISAVLPAVIADDGSPQRSAGYATGINPIVNLGEDLRRPNPVTAFTYTTTSKTEQYFTLSVLDDFSRDIWEAAIPSSGNTDLENIGKVPGRSGDLERTEATTEIAVGNVQGRWLPVPYAPRSITGLVGEWFWVADTLSVRTMGSNTRAQKYSVTSETITPTQNQLENAGTDFPDSYQKYLDLPSDIPPKIQARAESVVGDAETNFDKAIALQSYFRGSEFTYSEDAPVENDYDGSSVEVISRFLDEKSGYCVHFSSAMATMARTLGIPARVAVGFTGGESERNVETKLTTFTVTTDQLHAWPELYFDDLGWVRFEPTKSRGTVPVFPDQAAEDPNNPSSTPTPSRTPSPTATVPPRDDTTDGATGAGSALTPTSIAGSVLAITALLVLFLPLMVRTARRRGRFAESAGSGSALAPWQDLLDTARDLGWPIAATKTPRQAETDLSERMSHSGAPAAVTTSLDGLRRAVELEVFSGAAQADDAVDHVGAVRAVARQLRRSARIRRRILARLFPASVLTRSGVPRFGWLAPLVRERTDD